MKDQKASIQKWAKQNGVNVEFSHVDGEDIAKLTDFKSKSKATFRLFGDSGSYFIVGKPGQDQVYKQSNKLNLWLEDARGAAA